MQIHNPEIVRQNPLEDDVLAMTYANKDLIDLEPGLFATKWFDYRMMTPAAATRLYMDAFGDIYRQVYADVKDRTAAEHIAVPNCEVIMNELTCGDEKKEKRAKTRFASMWRGRQVADAAGMPYREFIDIAMRKRLRYWSNNKHLPQPQQLYLDWVVEHVMERWAELQSGRLYLAEHDAYMVQNYQGIAFQDDYHEWLFAQAQLRSNPTWQIAQFVNEDRLPLDKVESRFGEDDLELIRRHLI